MSQPQIHQRPAATNGLGRRRADRDVGSSRADSTFRSDAMNWRSSQAPSRSRSGGAVALGSTHGSVLFIGNSNAVNGVHRSFGDQLDASASGSAKEPALVERPLHDRLLFMAMCLIGQPVEVQVKNGSFYSGIFHAADVEKDFGVVLKMARLTKDGSVNGGKSGAVKEAARKAPQETLIIHAKDFVQITAKDVSLGGDALQNGRARENKSEIVTDAFLSQGRQRDVERELKPWKPDDENARVLGLESTFQNSWNRNWDQFEINKNLFGVETTFNEELYTTKLERGPQMREREREAARIAREIEGAVSKNIHQVEERGIPFAPELETMDEESRFSSVIRRKEKTDIVKDGDGKGLDSCDGETLGNSYSVVPSGPSHSTESRFVSVESESKPSRPSSADSTQTVDGPPQKNSLLSLQGRRASSIEHGDVVALDSQADTHREHLRLRHLLVGNKSTRSSKAGGSPYHSPVGRGSPLLSPLLGDGASIQALNLDPSCPQVPEEVYREFHEFKLQETARKGKKQREEQVNELKSFSESLKKKELEPRSPPAASKAIAGDAVGFSRHVSLEGETPRSSASAVIESLVSPNAPPVLSSGTQLWGTFRSKKKSLGSHSASPAVPPSSSVSSAVLGVLTSSGCKKSALNPNAKEFKLNPNARVFTPTLCSPRSASPNIQGPGAYLSSGLPKNAQIPGIPVVGMNVGQYLQQQQQRQQSGQQSQFTQYNNPIAAAAAVVSGSRQYIPQPPAGYIPGNGALSGQSGVKLHQQQSQQQVVGSHFVQQQQVRYAPQGHPMQPQPAYLHPNGQLYPQHMVYGQQQVLYVHQYSQGLIQGQPLPAPQSQSPSHSSQLPLQQKHRGGTIQQIHYASVPPSFSPVQHPVPQPQLSHLQNSMQAASSVLSPVSIPGVQPPQHVMVNTSGGGGSDTG